MPADARINLRVPTETKKRWELELKGQNMSQFIIARVERTITEDDNERALYFGVDRPELRVGGGLKEFISTNLQPAAPLTEEALHIAVPEPEEPEEPFPSACSRWPDHREGQFCWICGSWVR
jgi:hypothetical protein